MKYSCRTDLSLMLALASIVYGVASADEYHYRNIIIGDRATGMGGAYTAISDDPSGLFHNPAGVVYSGSRNFSASVNAYSETTKTYKGVLGGGDWERTSSALLPNFFGVTQPLGPGVIGFSYAVTDSIMEDQDSIFNNVGSIQDWVINVNNTDHTYKLGPSYAIEINDQLAVGMTLYMHFRGRELINNQWLRTTSNEQEWRNLYFQTEETGLEPVLGVMWSPFEQVSLGMSIRQTSILSSETTSQFICASDITGQTEPQCLPPVVSIANDPTILQSDLERDLPLQINLGVAYFYSSSLLLAADVINYGKTDRAESVSNLSLGAEYYFSERWAMRAGMFTNNANTPSVVSGGTDQLDNVDLLGLTFSLSHFTRNSSLTAGFSYSTGSGDAQVLSGSTDIQDLDVSGLTVFLSSSYNY